MTVNAQLSTQPSTRWNIDASHSNVTFKVRHMMISSVRGEFQKFDGAVTYDPQRPEDAKVSVSIDIASVNTREPKRDAHLRSADFFDAENFPTMTFESTQVRRRGDSLAIVGNLTIRGTSREVILAVEELTSEHTDPWGNRRIGASATTKIRRSEFGMTWNAALEAGGVLVADEVAINLEVELVKQS